MEVLLTLLRLYRTFRWQRLAMQMTAVYAVGTFMLVEILYFTAWCRPLVKDGKGSHDSVDGFAAS